MKRYPKPTKYHVINPQKYKGDLSNVVNRSSWERIFCKWCDTNPAIIEWGNETVIIPYIKPTDGEVHRYYMDFWLKVKDKTGKIDTYLVEIKPKVQCFPPDYSKRRRKPKKEVINEEITTYAVNQAKWRAAREYARKRGWKFMVITEEQLGIA